MRPSSVPAAMSLVIKPSAPRQNQTKDVFSCRHLEYLGDINGSTAPFNIAQALSINPGLPTFPWLAPIASAYELYKFKSLRFIYAGRSSSAIGGYCTLAMDYDPSDPPPSTKQEVNNFNDRVCVVPWEIKATLNCRSSGMTRLSKFMTRSSSIADDLGLYDLATLYVVTGNQTATTGIGELWVEYEVDFFQPQTNRPGPLLARNNAVFNHVVNVNYPGGSFTVPFLNTLYNPFGFTNAGGVISGVAGVFNVYAQIQYTAATAPTNAQLNIVKSGVAIQNVFLPGATASTLNLQAVVSLTAADTLSILAVFVGGTTIVFAAGAPVGSANIFQLTPA